METIKKYYKQILAVIGVIVGYIFLKKYFQKDILAELLNQKAKAKDEVLTERKNRITQEANDEQLRNNELRKELGKDAPKAKANDVEDFYKKKLN